MTEKILIRETRKDELGQILSIYPLAFPDEDLQPIVSKLLGGGEPVLSLAVFQEKAPVGHILFTIFNGEGEEDDHAGALLAPLGVSPDYQHQGLGGALVKKGFEQLDSMGVRQVFVLGDPNYYMRFGFQAEQHVLPPYQLPEQWRAAWQSVLLSDGKPLAGEKCLLPEAWMERALWLP